VEPTLVLTWNASGGAVQYKIQVAKDAAFTKLIVSEKVSGTTKELTSLAARSYYWRVKAINAEGFKSTWSQVFKFTVVIP
jgi:predicted phage tail protein